MKLSDESKAPIDEIVPGLAVFRHASVGYS
jgi:hypothetical protein